MLPLQRIMYSFKRYKNQYRANLKLALPVILAQLGQILVQFADNVMVGRYGGEDPLPLAAVSFGSSVAFMLFIAGIGVAMGLTPIVGELYAQGNRRASSNYLHNGVVFYTLLGVLLMALQFAFEPLLYHMGQPEAVVDMSIPYYRTLALSLPFVMLFGAFKQFLEGVGNTSIVMVIVLISNLLNVFLNWIFIYGALGASEFGVLGAGIATLIARMVTPFMLIAYFMRHRTYKVYMRGFCLSNISLRSIRRLVQMGLPIAAQMFLESSAFVGTGIMMGWFDEIAISANQIVTTMANSAFMIVMSIGAATTILASHSYGSRDVENLSRAVHASYHLGLVWNAFAAIMFILLRNYIPMLFTENQEVIALTADLLIFVALFQLSDGVQNISIGTLRGIQDVKIITPIAFLAYIVLNLPVGYLFGFKLGMGPEGLILGFTFGLTIAGVLAMIRIKHTMKILRKRFATISSDL